MKDDTPPEKKNKKKRLTHRVGPQDHAQKRAWSRLLEQPHRSKVRLTMRLEMLFYTNYLCMRKDLTNQILTSCQRRWGRVNLESNNGGRQPESLRFALDLGPDCWRKRLEEGYCAIVGERNHCLVITPLVTLPPLRKTLQTPRASTGACHSLGYFHTKNSILLRKKVSPPTSGRGRPAI